MPRSGTLPNAPAMGKSRLQNRGKRGHLHDIRLPGLMGATFFSSYNPLYSLAGFLVGALVGVTGVGGGSLMTPILVLLFNFHPVTAVGTDLLYASVTKTVGTAVHGKRQTVDWHIVGGLALGSVPASVATLFVMSRLDTLGSGDPFVLDVLLGSVLLLTAFAIFFRPWI